MRGTITHALIIYATLSLIPFTSLAQPGQFPTGRRWLANCDMPGFRSKVE